MRHAKASKEEVYHVDFERPLTERGKKDAVDMALRLANLSIRPNSIISSPARRTSKTAKIVAEVLNIDSAHISFDSQIYEASTDDLLCAIRHGKNESNCILLIGHNPSITGLIGVLTDTFSDSLPTSGIAIIELDIEVWKLTNKRTGKLLLVDYPKNISAF